MGTRLRHPLVQPAIQLLLAIVAGIYYGWPMLQIAGDRGTAIVFVYVFGGWSLLIVLLVAIGRGIAQTSEAPRAGAAGPDQGRR